MSGTRQPTAEELCEINRFVSEEEKVKLEAENCIEIPEFWAKVIKNMKMLEKYMNPQDFEALKACKHVECVEEKETTNIKLIFHFAENEFFTNQTLSVKLSFSEDGNDV